MITRDATSLERLRYAIAKQARSSYSIVSSYGEIELFEVFDDQHLHCFRVFLADLLQKQLSVVERGAK